MDPFRDLNSIPNKRIGTRYEYYTENFLGMSQLGCAIILLRHF